MEITLLGGFGVNAGGRDIPVEAWRRSKAKALVKILALSPQHRRHREQLIDLLWPEADAEAGAINLRKAIHHAREQLGADAILVQVEAVGLNPHQLSVDVDRFEAAGRAGDLQAALEAYGGELLPEDAYESWASERREQLKAELERMLLDRAAELEREGRPREAAAALERLVTLDPLHEEAHCRLIRLEAAAGNRSTALRWYASLEARLRAELGVEPSAEARRLRDDAAAGRPPEPAFGGVLLTMPQVHYALSGDVNIAYQAFGRGELDLVYVMGWVTHLGFMWHQPLCVRFFERLAEMARVLIFDKRGTGMSDRVPADRLPSLEQRMDDVRAVMDAAGSARAAVFGVSEGGPMAALFAATYPERTRALILYGTYAKRIRDAEYPWAPSREDREAFYRLIETSWGGPVDSADLAPSLAGDPSFSTWWARYCQMAVTPTAALALARMNSEVDIRNLMGSIRVPTLILHRRDDYESIGGAYYMAERIPNARLVVLPGADHYIYAGDQEQILEPIHDFLTALEEPPLPDTVLATILSLDAGDAGDSERRGLQMASEHEIARHRGRQLAGGSRIVAAFDGPARAVRCAQAIAAAARDLGLAVRAGIHTGECEVVGDRLRGPALAAAHDISSGADRHQVLVSQTVVDLVAGSGLEFVKRDDGRFVAAFTAREPAANSARTAPA